MRKADCQWGIARLWKKSARTDFSHGVLRFGASSLGSSTSDRASRHSCAVIGLGVMGAALARNIASHGFSVSVYNRTIEKTREFMKTFGNNNLVGKETLHDLLTSLERPRKIIIMVTAGDALDQVIGELTPLLQKADIIVDGGNSFYRDTIRREEVFAKHGLHFVGCGISGGEYGALHGPSLMVGGSNESYQKLEPILKAIAAKDFSGKSCVEHFGPNGAGHYVKMVHNGIEYVLLQLIAEAYDLLRKLYQLPADQIAVIFEDFSKGDLSSYLMEIAVKVLKKKDELAEGFLVDHIFPQAEQKGTGQWTVKDAFERRVSVPMIEASVRARSISQELHKNSFSRGSGDPPFASLRADAARSALRQAQGRPAQRVAKSSRKAIFMPFPALSQFRENLELALISGFYAAYHEGFALLEKASTDMKWDLNLSEIVRIWQGGCIIRSKMLLSILSPRTINPSVRTIVDFGKNASVSLPAFCAAVGEKPCDPNGPPPANLIQGMRDYFGSHGYRRTDREGIFHTSWLREGKCLPLEEK